MSSFSRRLFSHLCSSKSKKIALFCYLTWFLRFAMAQERSFQIETFIFIVSLSIRITKCSVTHNNEVMNIRDFLDYMLKSSKCGPHASKMKPWILYWLRSTQKYPHFEDFFVDQRWLKFLSHFNAMCDNNISVKSAEHYNLLGAFESALCRSNHFVFSKWLFLTGIWL